MRHTIQPPMTAEEFLDWAEHQPKEPRFELLGGELIAMAPGRLIHSRLKLRICNALQAAIDRAGLSCEAIVDGVGVKINDNSVYQPDALVTCSRDLTDDSRLIPEPVIIVEVTSPSTEGLDATSKLSGYLRLPSVRHYLIVKTDEKRVIHHGKRHNGEIEITDFSSDMLHLDPPGIEIDIDVIYRAAGVPAE